MMRFFDFCDKHHKPLLCLVLMGVLMCFVFPCNYEYALYSADGRVTFSDDVPYLVYIFGSAIFAIQQYDALFNGLLYVLLWLVLALSSIALLIVAMFRRNAWLPTVSLLLCWLASWYVSFDTYHSFATQFPELAEFNASANGCAALALFALYVIYLLLRRFYAPAKARVVASAERRKASRKPTKDERIAELEKRVAELESKDEHQKSTPS